MGESSEEVFEGVCIMINWRKPVIYSMLYLSGSKIPQNLREIKSLEKLSRNELKKYQEEKLKTLLLHAYQNVPYYQKVLKKAGIINNKEEVVLKNFNKIPILTKEIIRREGASLYSKDHKKRKSYENTSGGSTGEPVRFLQDKYYDDWNTATKLYFNKILGKDIGAPEIKLWGSDRDIILGNLTVKDRVINYLYNRKFVNCYDFSENKILDLIRLNNDFKPTAYWSYMEAACETAKYILQNKINVFSPKLIISTIGPLSEETRKIIKKAFNCKVYNQYGSREVGWISAEKEQKISMDIFFWKDLIEVLNLNNKNEGELIITTLDNFSMPLIRYKIGDVAEIINKKVSFSMGGTESYLKIRTVLGRTLGFFKRKDGSLFHTHHLVQQMFFQNWIKQFQLIQEKEDLILIRVVQSKKHKKKDLERIEKAIRSLTGDKIKIQWNFVKNIKKTKSGKYLYTICKI